MFACHLVTIIFCKIEQQKYQKKAVLLDFDKTAKSNTGPKSERLLYIIFIEPKKQWLNKQIELKKYGEN